MKVAFFTGAGISANAGIPVYRQNGSSWTDGDLEKKSHSTRYGNHLDELWDKHWGPLSAKMRAAEPTHTHKAIAEFTKRDDVEEIMVITQNIDNLHERAGTPAVHLHGNMTAKCMRCKSTEIARYMVGYGAPQCMNCDSCKTRPDVVLFGEALNKKQFKAADQWVQHEADHLIVIGSSLNVFPAGEIVMDALGRKNCIIINKDRVQFQKWFNKGYEADADEVIDEILGGL